MERLEINYQLVIEGKKAMIEGIYRGTSKTKGYVSSMET